jgi:hypothetical protein
VRHPEKTVAVPDHNVPTDVARAKGIANEESRIQVETLKANARDFGIEYYGVDDVRQGIVHIIGPSRAGRCPAPPSSAATATPRPTAPSARWPTGSGRARSSTCSPPRR